MPQARDLLIEWRVREMMDRLAAAERPELVAPLDDEQIDQARRLLIDALREKLGDIDGVRGAGIGAERSRLARSGSRHPSTGRSRTSMAEALGEIIQLRHVLVHRAGRVDARALKHAPSLPYAEGDLIRIDRAGYKRYSAALWTYGEECIRTWLRSALDHWATNYTINA